MTTPQELAEKVMEFINHNNIDIDIEQQRLLGRRGGGWTMAAVDPEGCDLRRGNGFARLDFAHPAADPRSLVKMLIALAAQARDAGC